MRSLSFPTFWILSNDLIFTQFNFCVGISQSLLYSLTHLNFIGYSLWLLHLKHWHKMLNHSINNTCSFSEIINPSIDFLILLCTQSIVIQDYSKQDINLSHNLCTFQLLSMMLQKHRRKRSNICAILTGTVNKRCNRGFRTLEMAN